MAGRVARIFLAFLFVFAQAVSIAQASDLLVSLSDLDNIDDISLEDVIPMDPFVSGSDTPAISDVAPMTDLLLYLVANGLNIVSSPEIHNFFCQPDQNMLRLYRPPKLWLQYHNLLI